MQAPSISQRPGRAALRSGLILGITLGIIHSVITIIVTQMNTNTLITTGSRINAGGITTPLYLLTPLLWIIGLLTAGIWGSQTTGKISMGTLAGLFAGTFGGIVAGLGQVVATAISANQVTLSSSEANLLLFSGFAAIFYVMLLTIGAGAGLGVLGGLIGQSLSSVRPQPPAQPVYQQPAPPYAPVQPVASPPHTYIPAQPVAPLQASFPPQPETPRLPEQ